MNMNAVTQTLRIAESQTPSDILVSRSEANLGALISGLDFSDPLTDEVKEKVDGLTAIHRPNSKAYKLIDDKEELDDYLREHDGVEHPIVITHPFNGKKVLYVNETFTHEIVGLAAGEGKALLDYL